MSRLRIALVLWVLVDLWRLWTPSLITIFGRAAETPPELIGLFALAVMGLPLLLVLAMARRHGRGLPLLLLVVALLARFLAPLDGGGWQLWVSSVGVTAAVTWLCLAAGNAAIDLWPGLFLGLVLETGSHALVGTWGVVWRDNTWGLVIDILMLFLAVWPGPVERPAASLSTSRALVVFPGLLLVLISLLSVARASTMTSPLWAAFLVVTAAGIASHLADRVVPGRRLRLGAAVALVLAAFVTMVPEVTRDGIEGVLPLWAIVGVIVGAPALALLTSGPTRPPRPGASVAAAGGAIVFTALLFAFYAGYDLGYRADWVIVGLAVVIALVTVRDPGGSARIETSVRGLVWAPLVAVAVAALSLTTVPPLDSARDESAEGLVVAAYNLRMGYGIDGTFDVRGVADQILDSGADVVLLSEIDRGWLLNGGQDQLAILARLTGMEAVFAPAADQVWGDAVLTRHPVIEQSSERFPSYDSLTGAEALTVVVDVDGTAVAVVSTHLQPDANATDGTARQAADLADLMERTAERTPHVVAGGDLNTTPDSEPWQTLLDTGYVDALAGERPLPTSPADDPDEEIDHLLVTGLRPIEGGAVPSRLSDHLMVWARLEISR